MAETGSHEELPIPPQSHDAGAGDLASDDALDSVPDAVAEEAQGPAAPETPALAAEAPSSSAATSPDTPLTAPVAASVPAAQEVVIAQQTLRPRVPWWPFFMYLGVWVGAVGAAAWLFVEAPATVSMASEALYPYTVRAGIVLTALGPLLAIVVWLVAWISAGRGRRSGLLADSLLKGALVTTVGVALWWIMLVVVDRFRFGRLW